MPKAKEETSAEIPAATACPQASAGTPPASTAESAPAAPEISPLQAILELARRGNPAILPKLRETLDQFPQIWQHYGDLAGAVERGWLRCLAGRDLLLTESITRELAAMRAGLKPKGRLEGLIVERIVAAWLEAQYAEIALSLAGDEGLRLREFRIKHLAAAERRFHAAVRSLALTRRLLGPAEMHVTHDHRIAPIPPAATPVDPPKATQDSPLAIPADRRNALFGGVPDPVLEEAHV